MMVYTLCTQQKGLPKQSLLSVYKHTCGTLGFTLNPYPSYPRQQSIALIKRYSSMPFYGASITPLTDHFTHNAPVPKLTACVSPATRLGADTPSVLLLAKYISRHSSPLCNTRSDFPQHTFPNGIVFSTSWRLAPLGGIGIFRAWI
jgi:hypothetical protein